MRTAQEWLQMLVKINTENPPGNEKELVDLIQKEVTWEEENGRVLDHGEGRASLLLSIEGMRKDICLGFAGHMDTVPAGERKGWRHDPFGAEMECGKLYGRGSTDMKGGLAAMLLLYEHYKKEKPPVNLRFLFTADEESGGTGAAALCREELLKELTALVVCEPSGLRPGVCEKGTLWLRFVVNGKQSHASMPSEGVNALEEGMDFLRQVRRMACEDGPSHPLLGGNSFTVTMCQCGVKINIIPGRAEFLADMRIIPNAGLGNDRWIERIRNLADRKEREEISSAVSVEVIDSREAVECPADSPFLSAVRRAAQSCGENPQETGIHFFTDAAILIPRLNIPFVILGPGRQEECHIAEESIELSQIDRAFTLYKRLVQEMVR